MIWAVLHKLGGSFPRGYRSDALPVAWMPGEVRQLDDAQARYLCLTYPCSFELEPNRPAAQDLALLAQIIAEQGPLDRLDLVERDRLAITYGKPPAFFGATLPFFPTGGVVSRDPKPSNITITLPPDVDVDEVVRTAQIALAGPHARGSGCTACEGQGFVPASGGVACPSCSDPAEPTLELEPPVTGDVPSETPPPPPPPPELELLAGKAPDIVALVETGAHDQHLAALHAAETQGKARKTVLQVLEQRVRLVGR